MKKSSHPSKRAYVLLLLGVLAVALVIYAITGGGMLLTGAEKQPADKQENLTYGLQYTPSSDHVLDRDGIALINLGDKVAARQLSSHIQVDAGNIAQRSQLPIVRMAEHVSYLYLYDGDTVYRVQIGGDGKVHTAVKDCLKFEPMGDYIYSIQEYKGQRWLYRCSLVGSNEKRLFDRATEDFWAWGGNLLMLDGDGGYRWYDVVTQNALDHTLPAGLSDLTLDSGGILYLLDGTVYRRPYMGQTDTPLAGDVLSMTADAAHIALLKTDGTVWLCDTDGQQMRCLMGMEFPHDAALDISAGGVFVTCSEGTVWYCALEQSGWDCVYDPAG